MPEYRRADAPGGAFVFTIVTYRRRPVLRSTAAVALLRRAIAADQRRRPSQATGPTSLLALPS